MRFDHTYSKPIFQYFDKAGTTFKVQTLEETEYPQYYSSGNDIEDDTCSGQNNNVPNQPVLTQVSVTSTETAELFEGNLTFQENCKGVSFEKLLVPHLKGARTVTIVDPYLRTYWQIRNLMELFEGLIKTKAADEEITINLITVADDFGSEKQIDFFDQIATSVMPAGIHFSYTFDETIHDREITTDTGWKIILGRGLDIFQNYDGNNTFALQNSLQEYRSCKSFGITYVKIMN
jgi:ATP-dependent Lon protease